MLSVRELCTEYPDKNGNVVKAAQDVAFEIPEGKLFTLLGPSGCGKTTTLRSIAGLERPVGGTIAVGNSIVYSSSRKVFVTPNKRNFGMVFQSYAIWPHMSVFENAAFPLRVGRKRFSKLEIDEKVGRVLSVVALENFSGREATKLSGGQQQRLALARALIMEPRLLLLDEPLSNLDAKLRDKMRFELKRLQRELSLTTIYVTHDQQEALALSHQIALMSSGRIVQLGTPREIYEKPASHFAADFVGTTNFVDATVRGRDSESDAWVVDSQVGTLRVLNNDALKAGDKISLSIRPENVRLLEHVERDATGHLLQGSVDSKLFLGEFVDFQIDLGGTKLLSRAHPSLRTPIGEKIYVDIQPEHCTLVRN
ncbi:ABC transporter ATP-binding protein [Neorhizobium sp. P12A]|uniref:ABC transporter ATP-binding protein n=1 Tax=Neorhizobium sp. P12A TaxID=2268027 RepID=UPI0011EE5A6E|nr:ABC transporter ATP-binding protein [Neorhizobium sp. P12A]KAA0698053.1 ABC transporter ATP-binding protein [Neorhizobium sp. P12A]